MRFKVGVTVPTRLVRLVDFPRFDMVQDVASQHCNLSKASFTGPDGIFQSFCFLYNGRGSAIQLFLTLNAMLLKKNQRFGHLL